MPDMSQQAPLSARDATDLIRSKAREGLEIIWTRHVKEQMARRDLLMGDILHLLKNGFVYGKGVPATRPGCFKYQMECKTPNSGSRIVRVVVIPQPDQALKLVTVMWKDEGWDKGESAMNREYQYTECGLDNVVIVNMDVIVDDADEEVYSIPNVHGLHKEIARSIITHNHAISPAELRFLRTEMGLTQAQLAVIVKKDHQTIGRWERGETEIDPNAEFTIRIVAAERLDIRTDTAAEELAARCIPSAEVQPITIDASERGHYRALTA